MQIWSHARRQAQRTWQRCWRIVVGGMIGVGVSGGAQAAPTSITTDQAPEAWVAYAGLVQSGIESVLSADEELLRLLQDAAVHEAVARVWVDNDGRLAVLELSDQSGTSFEHSLQKRLVGMQIGDEPPAGLRWPIVLRLDWSEALLQEEKDQPPEATVKESIAS